jgi:hypothetical protein
VARKVVGLDIGTTAVRAAEVSVRRGQVVLERVGQAGLPEPRPITYTGTRTTRIVGRGLTATSSLLSHYDSSGTTTASLTAVASVVVTVSVDLPSRSGTDVPATMLTSRVFLPNVAAAASEE